MDAERLPVTAEPLAHQHLHDPVSPVEAAEEKLNYDDELKKGHDAGYQQTTLDIKELDDEHYILGDPLPMPAGLPEEHAQFTFRAVFVGCCLGAVVQASNLYLGLKTGFTFGPQLLGGIGGFIILKSLSRVVPNVLPTWFGTGYFGPRENVTCQSAATAAGGLGILFVSGFPALYQLGLMSAKPTQDIGKLIGFMFSVAFYGMTFAVPLRAFYILRQRLVFPTPTATAYAIRSLHAPKDGAADARTKGRWLLWTFVVCFCQKTGSTYAPGILYDWHVFNWIAVWGAPKAQYLDNWGFLWEWTPVFFGAGILSGVNASLSFYGGLVLAWGIIGPALVATGRAVGVDISDGGPIPYRSYYSMSPKQPSSTNTSPRYNLLWIGVLVMLVSAFVELAVEWRTIAMGFSPIALKVRNSIRKRQGKEPVISKFDAPLVDPAPLKDQVRWYVWVPITVIAIIITCVVQGVGFGVNVGITILCIILAFLFSFIGVLSAGVTDINPVSTCAKASQLIVGGATHGKYTDTINPVNGYNNHALKINLLSGLISAGAASQACDLTGDLKTGHLIGAKPIAQYCAQFVGAFCSCFLSVAFFILFTTAAPCIVIASEDKCQYGIPSVAAWRAVAIVVTTTNGLPIPTTSGILAIVLTIVACIIILARVYVVPAKWKGYVPNPSAAGLGFVLYQTQYGAAMAVASLLAAWWKRRSPASYEKIAFVFAAGMITGEGLGGVMQAVLQIANAGLDKISDVGCPDGGC